MADETLRLPSTRFQAVFDLGDKRAAEITLPARLSRPELYAEWDETQLVCSLFVEFEDGQLHLDRSEAGIDFHFHDRSGESSTISPWPERDSAALVEWASVLAGEFFGRMPELMEDIQEAAAWQEAGYPLYVCETDPAFLDLLEVEIEGEILTLPWLGSGQVGQEHLEGDNHLVALMWNPEDAEPDRMIARAWLEPSTGAPATEAEPGVDWTAVGLPADEVLSWLEGTYLNHHIIPDAEAALIRAALNRMGGLDAR